MALPWWVWTLDGLSRGCLSEGVMRGEPMSGVIPLHLNAFERSSGVESWIRSWCEQPGDEQFLALTPEGWFERGHDIIGGAKNGDGVWLPEYKSGNYLWFPPPAAANISSRKPFLYSEIYLGGFSTKYCLFLTVDTFRRKKIGHRNVFMTDQYTTAEPSSCIYCNCTVTTACHNPLLIIISSRYIYPDIIQYDF